MRRQEPGEKSGAGTREGTLCGILRPLHLSYPPPEYRDTRTAAGDRVRDQAANYFPGGLPGGCNRLVRAYENIIQIWTPMAASESAMTKQQNTTNPIRNLPPFFYEGSSAPGNKYGDE
jgi:hypothetical protein